MVMKVMAGARVVGLAVLLATEFASERASAQARVPEGVFAEAGVGTGFSRYYEKAKAPHLTETKIRSRSLSSSLDLYLGGAPAPGVVLGVGVLGRSMLDPSIKVNGVLYESTSATLGLSALSVFTQWYPGVVPPEYGQLHLRLQTGISQSTVQFQHVALVGQRELGPMVGGAAGFSFAEVRGFRFGAEAQVIGNWLRASEGRAQVETSWYSATYGLTISYF